MKLILDKMVQRLLTINAVHPQSSSDDGVLVVEERPHEAKINENIKLKPAR
jgi:hypothetical protein